jgi:Ca2+-binding RTX toxin-like protein
MQLPLTRALNASGLLLETGDDPTSWIGSSIPGATLLGTPGPDALYSPGGAAVLAGGGGDDLYVLWEAKDRVVEAPGGGIDTLQSHAPWFVLPEAVENLAVAEDGASGTGNAAANLIAGGEGRQTLDGGAGEDVLTGGAGRDVFVMRQGNGRDVITDFEHGVDVLRLAGDLAGFGNFATVRAAMTQSGADVVLDLGAGDALIFRNRRIDGFTAGDFQLPVDRTALRATLSDDFDSFAVTPSGLDAGGKAVWRSTYLWGGRTLSGNHEAQFYSDATTGRDPFRAADGVLHITAAPTSGLPDGLTYSSGLITSQMSCVQTYGYFEMTAKLPAGGGFWPAFWLLPADGRWPPEIDVVEMLGQDPTTMYVTAHSNATGTHTTGTTWLHVDDLSVGFHSFAVSWRPDMIRWYFDGAEVFSVATPADMHRPMYMLANLAVGAAGSWPGPADGISSATMSIDSIRAWQFADLLAPSMPEPVAMRTTLGTRLGERLTGTSGEDRLEGGAGNDTLTGGTGGDVFAFWQGHGSDVVTDFQSGIDKVHLFGAAASKYTTRAVAAGIEITFGKDKVLLAGVSKLASGDILGAVALSGDDAANLLDRGTATAPLQLSGLAGDDTLRGGSGADWITGGTGDDVMSGGRGADRFVVSPGDGHDRIADFQTGIDRVVFQAIAPGTVFVNRAIVDGVAGIEINHGTGGDSIFLPGVTAFRSGDLAFA